MTHDWNGILQEAGEEPLAPCSMRWIDTSLDAAAATAKCWSIVDDKFSSDNSRAELFDRLDLVTRNLIAAHYTSDDKDCITLYHLEHAFRNGRTPIDVRRYLLLALMEEKVSKRDTISIINKLIRSQDPILRQYPITTDTGITAQHGIVKFILRLFEPRDYELEASVLSDDIGPVNTQLFVNPSLFYYLLENPENAELIASTIWERRTTDMEMIHRIITSDTPSLSQGML